MEKEKMIEMALDKIFNELDEIEGGSAMAHSMEECPDPLTCKMHDKELGEDLPKDKEPEIVKIEAHKIGMPSLDGAKEKEEGKESEGLSEEEAEELKKLLK